MVIAVRPGDSEVAVALFVFFTLPYSSRGLFVLRRGVWFRGREAGIALWLWVKKLLVYAVVSVCICVTLPPCPRTASLNALLGSQARPYAREEN